MEIAPVEKHESKDANLNVEGQQFPHNEVEGMNYYTQQNNPNNKNKNNIYSSSITCMIHLP